MPDPENSADEDAMQMQVAVEKWWHAKFIPHMPTQSEFILGNLAFAAGWRAARSLRRRLRSLRTSRGIGGRDDD